MNYAESRREEAEAERLNYKATMQEIRALLDKMDAGNDFSPNKNSIECAFQHLDDAYDEDLSRIARILDDGVIPYVDEN